MKQIIDQFASYDLFGRDNYEYYARVTGRVLRVQDEWICSFRYPAPPRGKLTNQKHLIKNLTLFLYTSIVFFFKSINRYTSFFLNSTVIT